MQSSKDVCCGTHKSQVVLEGASTARHGPARRVLCPTLVCFGHHLTPRLTPPGPELLPFPDSSFFAATPNLHHPQSLSAASYLLSLSQHHPILPVSVPILYLPVPSDDGPLVISRHLRLDPLRPHNSPPLPPSFLVLVYLFTHTIPPKTPPFRVLRRSYQHIQRRRGRRRRRRSRH